VNERVLSAWHGHWPQNPREYGRGQRRGADISFRIADCRF
jgi:hypothetical protein